MRTLLIVVVLLNISLVATAEEASVWACLESNNSGLRWENTRWVTTTFERTNFLLRINGQNSTVSTNGVSSLFDCSISVLPQIISCNDILGGQLLFNTVTRVGTSSSIVGGVIGPGDDSFRDTLNVRTFQCNPVE